MSPYLSIMFLSILILGTTMTMSSSHWLLAWMGLELNTFAIIPLMAQKNNPRALEATLKYFIVQATAAIMLLFASTLNAWFAGQWNIQYIVHPIPLTIFTIALALKMGLAPVHAWFPEVLQGLDFKMGLILSTWQKLAPLILLAQISHKYTILHLILGLTSILVGGWGGINQTQLRKILAYSSIAHLGWIFLIIHYIPSIALMAFLIYTILTLALFFSFDSLRSTSINSLSTSWAKNPYLTSTLPMTLFSLGGLPPFTGFISKWVVIYELTKQEMMMVATISALSALLSLFFYLRLSYAIAMTTSPHNTPAFLPWRLPFLTPPFFLAMLLSASFSLLPTSPSMLAFFLF